MPFDPTKLSMDPNVAAQVDLHEQLIVKRGEEYGDTITPTDLWIKEHIKELAAAPSPFTLIMIYNKLHRALTSPNKQDHYDDVCGYAKLALKRLRGESIAPSQSLDEKVLTASHWLHERD